MFINWLHDKHVFAVNHFYHLLGEQKYRAPYNSSLSSDSKYGLKKKVDMKATSNSIEREK